MTAVRFGHQSKGITRSLRGRRAKAEGAAFEGILLHAAIRANAAVVQIPTGAKVIGHVNGKPRLVPIKTPFDYVFAKDECVIFFDAKSLNEKSLKHRSINKHQLEALLKLEIAGFKAGYVVHLRALDQIVFFKASTLSQLQPRKSLNPNDGEVVGSDRDINFMKLLTKEPA